MSNKAITWAWEQPVACARDRLVLMALADHANDDGECFPSQPQLAVKAMCSVDSVQRSLKRLIASGYVAIKSRGGIGNGRWANVYKLPVAVIVKQPAENDELQSNLREMAKPQDAVLPGAKPQTAGGLNRNLLRHQPSLNQPSPKNTGGLSARVFDPSDLSDLNDATAEIVKGIAYYFRNHGPDYEAARKFVASNVAMFGHEAVRDGYAELMAAQATPGRIVQPSVKTLVGYFRQAKGRPAKQPKSPKQSDYDARMAAARASLRKVFSQPEVKP